MSGRPEVLLTMPARPEGVGVVRQALAGMADALDFEASVLADMKMAVTEACTNVVVHAYDADSGMLEVEMLAAENGLTIVVRDHGSGIQPRGSAGRGTEVRMTFAYSRDADPADANPVTGTVGIDGRWDPEAPSHGSPAGG
jgi:anti-sigma regulatory factor (Ser/Thr protein kinase)